MPNRKLRDQDFALWVKVARTITPLPGRRIPDQFPPAAGHSPAQSATPAKPLAVPLPAAKRPAVPPLMAIDRSTRQRLARGLQPIDARLDLHGRTQAEAYAALLRFLHRAQAQHARIVLIITGKGDRDPLRERGVLRRQVPLWLATPAFRGLVVGFEPAQPVHGGEGAFYVHVRRAR